MERLLEVLGIILIVFLISGCASDGMTPSSSVSETTTITSDSAPTSSSADKAPSPAPGSTSDRDRIARGAVEDTLEECLSRIPKEATAGQKMLAEQSCRRDHAYR